MGKDRDRFWWELASTIILVLAYAGVVIWLGKLGVPW